MKGVRINKDFNKIKNELVVLRGEVTEEDRLKAALHINSSYSTVLRYLNGEFTIKNYSKAKNLLNYLKKEIAIPA